MKSYKYEFIQFSLQKEALLFGEFTLKSGRKSPYFFNAGNFKTGADIARLGHFYAAALKNRFSPQDYDLLFGPAYKGIPLVTTTAIALATQHQQNIPFCFNRKEPKDHAEGGMVVGASMYGKRVILIDDVVTAGTTIDEATVLIKQEQGKFVGAVVALDRKEKGKTALSTIQEAEETYQISIASIVDMDDLIQYLTLAATAQNKVQFEQYLVQASAYREQYGVITA